MLSKKTIPIGRNALQKQQTLSYYKKNSLPPYKFRHIITSTTSTSKPNQEKSKIHNSVKKNGREGEGVVLLSAWASVFAVKVKNALSEKGVEYENREEDLSNKSDLLLKMNPIHKKIPVLIHDGRPVCESTIIVEYIDQVWNRGSPLLPSDPHKRAHARFWADFADKKVVSAVHSAWFGTREAQEGGKKDQAESMKLLEEELGEKAYFGGESFGHLDLSLVGYYWWFQTLEKTLNLGLSRELELPKLEEWLKRCLLRESVATALPDQDKLGDCFLQIRKKKLEVQAPDN